MRLWVLVALFAFIVVSAAPAAHSQTTKGWSLAIIVNKKNPVNTITQSELANIFLDKKSVWSAGMTIQTCDLIEPGVSEENSARAIFAEHILHKDMLSLKNYWIKMIFSAKRRPPVAFKHADDVIRFVSENPGGIGYVYANQVTGNVKTVQVRFND